MDFRCSSKDISLDTEAFSQQLGIHYTTYQHISHHLLSTRIENSSTTLVFCTSPEVSVALSGSTQKCHWFFLVPFSAQDWLYFPVKLKHCCYIISSQIYILVYSKVQPSLFTAYLVYCVLQFVPIIHKLPRLSQDLRGQKKGWCLLAYIKTRPD